MTFKFCPVCGAGMEQFTEDGFPREKCGKCGWVHYHNPRPTVSAIIPLRQKTPPLAVGMNGEEDPAKPHVAPRSLGEVGRSGVWLGRDETLGEKIPRQKRSGGRGGFISCDKKVLLCHRAVDPFKGKWDLPGGFLEEKETPQDGLKREMKEELGIDIEIGKLIGIFGPTYYPFDGQELYNVDMYYEVKIISGEPAAVTGSDVMEVDWFDPDNLPEMAFEPNVEAIKTWREQA